MKRSLRSWLWRVPIDQEVDDELALHIELRTRELIERGMEPQAARDLVVSRIGDLGQLKRTCVDLGRKREREMRMTRWIEELTDDVTFALRQLRRSPGFTLVAALTLALGIGANSAMFALADATLLRPFPFPEPDRLVMVFEKFRAFPRTAVASLNFRDWRDRNRTFQSMAAVFTYPRRIAAPDGTVEEILSQQVTTEFFDVLGIKPIAGRTFLPTDEALPPNVVVLSEGYWRTRFGGDPALIGRTVRIDGDAFTVLGVVPEEARILSPASIWTVFIELPGMDARGIHFLQVIGRLKPGTTIDAARSDMTTVAEGLAEELPATNTGRGVTVDPLRTGLVASEVRLTSYLLLGVVGFVLLMCCANVANLLLARTNGRARELALRSALGAGRGRIVAQILTESLVLAALGGALGLGVGAVILSVAPAVVPAGLLPPAVILTFDGRIVVFCAVAAFVTGLLFGLAPAWHATSASLVQVLSSESRTTTAGSGRFRSLLVVGEVSAAVLLLCGAGLLLRTLVALENVNAGYTAESVLTMRVNLPYGLPTSRYATVDALRRFFEASEQEIARVPGVRSAAWTSGLPLEGSSLGSYSFSIVGDTAASSSNRPSAYYQIVSPAYRRTLGIPLIAGRDFTDRDTATAPQVCLVNDAFVRRYLQGKTPLGLRITIGQMGLAAAPPIEREIVGVIRHVKISATETDDVAQVYVPISQNTWSSAALVVQPIGGRAEALAPAIREAVARVDREVPLVAVRTLDDVARVANTRPRFRAGVVVTFAGLALVLAMVGVFGVLAYSVQQRTREFGVRIALGASAGNVLRMVLANAARVIGAGAIVGLILAAMLAQTIATFLFGVTPLDPLTFVAVVVVLGVTAAIASAVPAIRAARVDPVVAFRAE
jgi:putative ABC transport system permease protein